MVFVFVCQALLGAVIAESWLHGAHVIEEAFTTQSCPHTLEQDDFGL